MPGGTTTQQDTSAYLSRTDEFRGGQGTGPSNMRTAQQNVPRGFQTTSMLTPLPRPLGQSAGDAERRFTLNAYRY
jgi:hypothetical protein